MVTSRGMGRAVLLMVCIFVLLSLLLAGTWLLGNALVELVSGLVGDDSGTSIGR